MPPLSQRSTARDWTLQGISDLVNKIDCCLSKDSCQTTSQALFAPDCVPAGSLHFVPFHSADLPCYEILCSGFLNRPLPYGTLLEVSPEERHTLIGCSTQLHRSAMGVMHVSQGWLLNVPFLVVILFFWDPEASAPDNKSEWSLPVETLEVLLRDSSRNPISSPFPVPPLLVDLLVEIHVGVLMWRDGSLTKRITCEPKRNSGSCRCVCRKSRVGHRICNDVT
jgi:hypothetical protein